MKKKINTQVVVIGSGPGGYAAAFRASDLGYKVTLIEKNDNLGGVCLNVGCIPSKALLHIVKVMKEASEIKKMGVEYPNPKINLEGIRKWKNTAISKLNKGISGLATARNINLISGKASFLSDSELTVISEKEEIIINFENCIIATGSSPSKIDEFPNDNRIMDSTDALTLKNIPKNLLVIGGGYIGLEMGTIYAGLGSNVTVAEFSNTLLPGADSDLVTPLVKKLKKEFKEIKLKTKVTNIVAEQDYLKVKFESENNNVVHEKFDKVLVSIGRKPNTESLGLDKTNIKLDKSGYIIVDSKMRSSVHNILQ